MRDDELSMNLLRRREDDVDCGETLLENVRHGTWRKEVLGDYNWGFLCMPTLPWSSNRSQPPFFEKDEKLPLLLALVMGLQHALAMVGGIIVGPILLTTSAKFSPEEQQYTVSASLIVSGVASLIQIMQIRIPHTRYVIGSGMLSVMGVTFSYVPIALQTIATLGRCSCDGVSCLQSETCDVCPGTLSGDCLSGREAYGRVLGTIFFSCWLQVALSFAPQKFFKRVFPPVVTGPVIILVGVALITSGFSQWGGGTSCANQVLTSKILCDGNGEVKLPFGDGHYIGLGLVVFATLIVVELFGSPFLRNSQIVIGLIVGMIVASAVHVTKCEGEECVQYRFVTVDKIREAPWITYLYRYTYPLGIYLPAVLPMLFCSMSSLMDTIGDVTATYEASRLAPSGPEYEKSIQGAILADGINSLWAALSTMLPLVSYAQNNGVISLSGCASRRAGYGCAFWLIFLGTFSKFAAMILTIPDCILGAMTTFLFASVSVSGIQILYSQRQFTRRNRFIVIMALGIGVGVSLIPAWANISGQSGYPYEGNLWPVDPSWSREYRGFRDAIILLLSNGFTAGAVVAITLNLILPADEENQVIASLNRQLFVANEEIFCAISAHRVVKNELYIKVLDSSRQGLVEVNYEQNRRQLFQESEEI